MARRDDKVLRLIQMFPCMHCPEFILIACGNNLLAETDVQVKLFCIRLQIFDHLRARRISRVGERIWEIRQLRVLFVGVQVQPVIVAVPNRPNLIALLQDQAWNIRLLETSPTASPAGPAPMTIVWLTIGRSDIYEVCPVPAYSASNLLF
jgi:hypothetical protein